MAARSDVTEREASVVGEDVRHGRAARAGDVRDGEVHDDGGAPHVDTRDVDVELPVARCRQRPEGVRVDEVRVGHVGDVADRRDGVGRVAADAALDGCSRVIDIARRTGGACGTLRPGRARIAVVAILTIAPAWR